MNSIIVKFKKLEPSAQLPSYASAGASGMDVRALEDGTVFPCYNNQLTKLVKTGLSVELPEGYEMQVRPRSGLAVKLAVTVPNSPGTIDSDYRGELMVALINHSESPFHYKKGDRIAQLVIAPVIQAAIVEIEELSDTQRGEGGFGSTGVN